MPRSSWIALAGLASLVGALVLAGCGKPPEPTSAATAVPKSAVSPAAPGTGTERTSIQAKGSDTMLQVAQALAEAYKKVEPSVDVTVTGGGSLTGFKAIMDGTADIANSSRQAKPAEEQAAAEKGFELVEHVVGYDALAVIVNKENPVEKLTIDQIAAIYTGEIRDWAEVGGKGEIVLLSRDTSSGTYDYFREHVLNKGDSKGTREFAPSAALLPSTDQIRAQVAQTPAAIGYIGLGYVDDTVKVLSVVSDQGKAVPASVEAAKDGSYPISRPLFMYTKRGCAPAISKYIEWIKGPEGQNVVAAEGFVPL